MSYGRDEAIANRDLEIALLQEQVEQQSKTIARYESEIVPDYVAQLEALDKERVEAVEARDDYAQKFTREWDARSAAEAEVERLREALIAARQFVACVGVTTEPGDQWRYALLPKIDEALR